MALSRRLEFGLSVSALVALALAGALWAATSTGDVAVYLPPTLGSLLVFGLFSVLLQRRLAGNIFGEIGFLYLGFALAYTVLPGFGFMAAGLVEGAPLTSLLPDRTELTIHLWRHTLFLGSVAAGYLLIRGDRVAESVLVADDPQRDTRALVFVTLLLGASIAIILLMSAPVESYYDHYVRYDHLSWLPRKLVSVAIRLSLALYCVLLVLLFRNYRRYRLIIPIVVLAICTHETLYSFGARILSLIVILQALCLYHFMVRRISLKWGAVALLLLGAIFSAVELVRVMEFDIDSARSAVADEGLSPAAEFFAVFYSGFQLYAERAAGTLPPREWPMFFQDFVSVVTWGDMTRWNPMYWYAENYYPDAAVPPFTMGPIANSALWGGEIDLLLRGLVNGAFFAYLMRWFLRHRDRWWGVSVYVFCYATSIMTLKYSVFYHLTPIVKNLLPTLLLVAVVRKVRLLPPRAVGIESGLAHASRPSA